MNARELSRLKEQADESGRVKEKVLSISSLSTKLISTTCVAIIILHCNNYYGALQLECSPYG